MVTETLFELTCTKPQARAQDRVGTYQQVCSLPADHPNSCELTWVECSTPHQETT